MRVLVRDRCSLGDGIGARPVGRAACWLQRGERGSALIEFVILVPLLILLLLVIADFGRLTPWAQQVAFSADAGAQYVYQVYSLEYSRDEISSHIGDIRNDAVDAAKNAVPALGLEDGDITVNEIWRCRSVDYDDTMEPKIITVRYISAPADGPLADCDVESCGGQACEDKSVLFIDVVVTDSFKPFSKFINNILPNSLVNFSFSSHREIFIDEPLPSP